MPVSRSALGARISAACGMRGVSMSELAREVGITRNSMSRIVRGDIESPRAEIVTRIARHLEVSTDYLLGLKDTMEAGREAASVA